MYAFILPPCSQIESTTDQHLNINMSNFFALLHRKIRQSADRVFLDLEDQPSITYGEADRMSAQAANWLHRLGLKPGDRVTMQVDKSEHAVILYLACLRAGVVFHPLNAAYTLNELEHFFQDAQPTLVVCRSIMEHRIRPLASRFGIGHVETLDEDGGGSLLGEIFAESEQFDIVGREPDDTALLIYTSGTTGKPKGAMITHHNLSSNLISLMDTWEWNEEDVILHVLPLFHVHGLCPALHCPILGGSRILFQNRFSVSKAIDLIPNSTVLMAVPTIYTRLLSDERLTVELCRNIRIFLSGSAPLLPEISNEFEQRTGHRIMERYGMSEGQMITSNPFRGDRLIGSVGLAFPDISLRICDQSGELLKHNEIGMLEVKGPNVFRGYWRNPEATSKAFRNDGYFITGDLGMIDTDGYLTIVGRESDLIISAGLNIYPKEIEDQINRLPGVADSAVFAVPHPDLGEAVFATVVGQENSTLTADGINAAIEERLSAFKIPKRIEFVDELPRNAMGKVEKKQLRIRYQSEFVD